MLKLLYTNSELSLTDGEGNISLEYYPPQNHFEHSTTILFCQKMITNKFIFSLILMQLDSPEQINILIIAFSNETMRAISSISLPFPSISQINILIPSSLPFLSIVTPPCVRALNPEKPKSMKRW